MYFDPEFQAPIFCFSAQTHKTGQFFIPKEVKDAMSWERDEEYDLWFLVFGASGKKLYQDIHRTKSGSEVNLGGRLLTAHTTINVVVLRP